jgi:hypothetical protein
VFILQRDPVCKICHRAASSHVDHIVPFIKPDGSVSWALFSDVTNLRGLCAPCHDRATATFDGGFGNVRKEGKTDYVAPTGGAGRQYTSGSVNVQKLDELIPAVTMTSLRSCQASRSCEKPKAEQNQKAGKSKASTIRRNRPIQTNRPHFWPDTSRLWQLERQLTLRPAPRRLSPGNRNDTPRKRCYEGYFDKYWRFISLSHFQWVPASTRLFFAS